MTQKANGLYGKTKDTLGWVLIFLDSCMMMGSLVAIVAVAVLLKKAKKMMDEDDINNGATVVKSTAVAPIRKYTKWKLSQEHISKAVHHAQVEKTEEEAVMIGELNRIARTAGGTKTGSAPEGPRVRHPRSFHPKY